MKFRDKEALDYHEFPVPGKVEVVSTKPCFTQHDLSMAYTPGVAVPCLEIEKNPSDAYRYTNKGNLVAVVSNGTAVLGLGDIGALGGKPVMEGKGVLFKRFANIDVFDIELDTKDPDEIIQTCKLMAPTFGGINLEDIKAPECFYIEEKLREELNIPVFHDDQHGTAIIAGAGLINAAEITGKDIAKSRLVVVGAGAAGIACANIFVSLGVSKKNILMCDSKGVIYKGRKEGMNPYKERYATDGPERTLEEAMVGAEIFIGLAKKDLLTDKMLKSMGKDPIIFAMANPDPEVTPERARAARPDAIIATGRSDYPNQINNVLGFPFIFRGALDVRATAINEEMKVAAVKALANLAKEPVPDEVRAAYDGDDIRFGRDYIIPKPFDPRVLLWEAPAVAEAAIATGVAMKPYTSKDDYRRQLEKTLGRSREVMRYVFDKANKKMADIVYPEGENERVLRACQTIIDQQIAKPILLGREEIIKAKIEDLGLNLDGIKIIDPLTSDMRHGFAELLYEKRQRKGMTPQRALSLMRDPLRFGLMMVDHPKYADGLVGGLQSTYGDVVRPALKYIGLKEGFNRAIALMLVVLPKRTLIFADVAINDGITPEILADIAILSGMQARELGIEPRVAMLSHTNFGEKDSTGMAARASKALKIVKMRAPELHIDGEMMADAALDPTIINEQFPHSLIKGDANVLVFPCLSSANIAYKMMQKIGGAEVIGPVIKGLNKPINVLNYHSTAADVINLTALTAMNCKTHKKGKN